MLRNPDGSIENKGHRIPTVKNYLSCFFKKDTGDGILGQQS